MVKPLPATEKSWVRFPDVAFGGDVMESFDKFMYGLGFGLFTFLMGIFVIGMYTLIHGVACPFSENWQFLFGVTIIGMFCGWFVVAFCD